MSASQHPSPHLHTQASSIHPWPLQARQTHWQQRAWEQPRKGVCIACISQAVWRRNSRGPGYLMHGQQEGYAGHRFQLGTPSWPHRFYTILRMWLAELQSRALQHPGPVPKGSSTAAIPQNSRGERRGRSGRLFLLPGTCSGQAPSMKSTSHL